MLSVSLAQVIDIDYDKFPVFFSALREPESIQSNTEKVLRMMHAMGTRAWRVRLDSKYISSRARTHHDWPLSLSLRAFSSRSVVFLR